MMGRMSAGEIPVTANAGGLCLIRRKWSKITPLLVIVLVAAELMLLGRLDMAKNAAMVNSWAHSFYSSSASLDLVSSDFDTSMKIDWPASAEERSSVDSCEEWLERADTLSYSRDFRIDPIVVQGAQKEWRSCSVNCTFGYKAKNPDAVFGVTQDSNIPCILRSMESSRYYPENSLTMARRRGYNVVMTTSLSSDVPVGYFSWAEYDIMAPVMAKSEESLAAAFISNCGANNFRLEALTLLEKLGIKIDSYGGCHRNRNGAVDKIETLKRYKFSLAFENSNEEDYVTEKFFQSLVAGTIPVVIGAPNIHDFAPSPNSILHIKELTDVPFVAKSMKNIAENPVAFNNALRWKNEGPTDSFKALVDMAAVHSSCRLCIHLATQIQRNEENTTRFHKRPCHCTRGGQTTYHLFARERGRLEMVSIFMRSSNLTLKALAHVVSQKFKSLNHIPVWMEERPKSLKAQTWKIYRIYPVGMTQKEALYTFTFGSDSDLRHYVERTPCAKLEVIFV